jgi:hypothetical protein
LFIQITFMVYQNFKRKLSKNPKTWTNYSQQRI